MDEQGLPQVTNAELIADLDPNEWVLPPKPKWMRLRTYEALERKFDAYEEFLYRVGGTALTQLMHRMG